MLKHRQGKAHVERLIEVAEQQHGKLPAEAKKALETILIGVYDLAYEEGMLFVMNRLSDLTGDILKRLEKSRGKK